MTRKHLGVRGNKEIQIKVEILILFTKFAKSTKLGTNVCVGINFQNTAIGRITSTMLLTTDEGGYPCLLSDHKVKHPVFDY